MRSDDIVPLGVYAAALQSHALFLCGRHSVARLVFGRIETGPAMEPVRRPRGADVVEHHVVADQRFPSPVAADRAEHPVIDRVPFRRPSRIVGHGDGQSKLVRQPLQRHLPLPFAIVVGPTRVRLDQQPLGSGVTMAPDIQPPAADGRHREAGCLVRRADHHVAVVVAHVVDAVRDATPVRPTREVVGEYGTRSLPPASARVLEVDPPTPSSWYRR